jgi:Tfp pilus assembly protein PilF
MSARSMEAKVRPCRHVRYRMAWGLATRGWRRSKKAGCCPLKFTVGGTSGARGALDLKLQHFSTAEKLEIRAAVVGDNSKAHTNAEWYIPTSRRGWRMGRLRNQTFFLLLVLVVPSKAVSQLSNNYVTASGMVLAEGNNQRIEHVVVRLCDGGGNLLEQAITPESGEFSFRGLQRGHYILTFQANEYQSTDFQLDLSYTSDKGITIYMKPVRTKPLAVSPGSSVSVHELSIPEEARNLVKSGKKKLYVNKNAAAALQDFEQAVAKAPGYYEAFGEIAMAYLTMSKPDQAQENFRKSIELSHDTYGDSDVGLGTLLIEKGDIEAGEKAIRRGVELNPNSWMGFYELGKLDLNRAYLDPALKSAERAKSLAPNVPIIYRLLANIHMRQKDYTALIRDLDAYIKLDPDSPAGVRAAQMRDQVVQEVAKHGQPAHPEFKSQ